MTDRHRDGTAWILVKTTAFTLVMPGTVVILVPYLLLPNASLQAVDVFGIGMLGLLPVLFGSALYLRCAFDFALTGRGTPAPVDAPTRLVTRGPYVYTRNPMYIAVLSMLAGEALLYRSLSLAYLLAALAVLFHLFTVGYEERALGRQFGAAYARYRETVPRWIPRRSGLEVLYRGSFRRIGALVLAAGAIAHLMRLTVGLPVLEMPVSIHAFLVVLPAYGGLGCIAYARRIDLPRLHEKTLYALTTGLLVATVVMHAYSIVARDNEWHRVFPLWYSVFAMFVYGGLAHFLKSRTFMDALADPHPADPHPG